MVPDTAPIFPGRRPLAAMGVAILLVALFGGFASARFRHAGEWVPAIPNTIGHWESIDSPIAAEILEGLGNPPTISKMYVNPLGERVYASVMAVGPFENYHDPMVCIAGGGNFSMTAREIFPLDGPGSGKIRAMIFRRRDGAVRMLMYYWQQSRDGSTDTSARMGNYRDMLARFDTGLGAVVIGRQTCLMRIHAFIRPDDPDGVQAQRNVEEISRTIYQALRRDAGLEPLK
ncbi:MAG: exosortase-associated EpsI family protein [Capsulimonadales bacterium]|nr:exosortase-associated EpsI family protein [Capsulimonadales bacterium]